MTWSNSKDFCQKWYRICHGQNGDKEILEADHKWSIERGLGDDWEAEFNHYFYRRDRWFCQRNIKYKYLFFDPNDRVALGYEIESLQEDREKLDQLFTELQSIEGWMLFLEDQICDGIMAIDYKEASILECQAKIASYRHLSDSAYEIDIQVQEEQIAKLTQALQKLQVEQAQLIQRLLDEEGIEW